MLNLLVNSRDAMPDGGVIRVVTALQCVSPGAPAGMPGSIGQIAAGRYISVSVSDTGHGIEPHLLERVFEPFFTTKPFGKGTGLGLSTVIGFVRQSGGDVTLTSELSLGTDVTLYFPVAPGAAITPPAVTAGASKPTDPTPDR
jgi:signal transduction histidine kinase